MTYVWLVFKSGFKSRAGYSGARTVNVFIVCASIDDIGLNLLVINVRSLKIVGIMFVNDEFLICEFNMYNLIHIQKQSYTINKPERGKFQLRMQV